MKRAQVKAKARMPEYAAATSLNSHEFLSGPSVEMSANVPQRLLQFVRERTGDDGFSQLVTHALFREAVRLAREELVKDVEDSSGPLDLAAVDAALKALRS
jgi:hypothetical protein